MDKNMKIFVAGHKGMVGSAIVRRLTESGYNNIIAATKSELNLTNQEQTRNFFQFHKPDFVFMAAAKVGGIKANNDFKADFIYDNIMIQSNIIKSAFEVGVENLIFLGSSCIYPKKSPQPIKEDYLLSDYLEPTNDAYAIAKIAGVKMCQAFNKQWGTNYISVMPCNLYGVGDNYHPENSHVFPAIIRKFHEAKINGHKEILLWGDGTPMREFLNSDDLASALVFLMERGSEWDLINVGTGFDLTIKDLAEKIRDQVYPSCEIVFNGEVSINGTARKVMDVSRINQMGWCPQISLEEGIKLAYQDFLSRKE